MSARLGATLETTAPTPSPIGPKAAICAGISPTNSPAAANAPGG
jgi:hypothetical protein